MADLSNENGHGDELYDHDVPLTMRADCSGCDHPAADHPVDLGGREAIAFACLRPGCDCRNWQPPRGADIGSEGQQR